MPATSAAIQTTPEPAKPSQWVDSGPSVKPSTPPAWPGRRGSHWYRRVHSSEQLAAINSTSPAQKAARGHRGAATAASPSRRTARARLDNQARKPTGTSHHTDQPNRNSPRSENQAPTMPALLRSGAPSPEVEKPGSPRWCVNSASSSSSQATAPMINAA